jgi:hypothetical protein
MKTMIVILSLVGIIIFTPYGQAREILPDTQPAPLMMAKGESQFLSFQFGLDLFGGAALGNAEFVGGLNMALLYPICDLLWAGIRPAMHYVQLDDADFDVAWFHPDIALQLNVFHAPLRLYVLAAGGFSVASDTDFYQGIAHGWSATAGVGAEWKFENQLGLFAELGFRLAQASGTQQVLSRNAAGQPICTDDECLVWQTEKVTREFELSALTINLGISY